MQYLHERITYYRNKKELPQSEIANRMDMQRQNYRKYETGERVPSHDRLIMIADILEVSHLDLKYGAEQTFLTKLNRILRDVALGEWKCLTFLMDELSEEKLVYQPMQAVILKWIKIIKDKYPAFWNEFVKESSIEKLVKLTVHLKKSERAWWNRQPYQVADIVQSICPEAEQGRSVQIDGEEFVEVIPQRFDYENAQLPGFIYLRLAFCYCVLAYTMKIEIERISEDVVQYYGVEQEDIVQEDTDTTGESDVLSDEECEKATTLFGIKIYIPFLKIIIEAMEIICDHGTMDDFESVLINGEISTKRK